MTRSKLAFSAVPGAAVLLLPAVAQGARPMPTRPDFTKGGEINPKKHDWNLGPTGARGWMFGWKLETTAARQILVTKVDQGSPADGVLTKGDVLLGVDANDGKLHGPLGGYGALNQAGLVCHLSMVLARNSHGERERGPGQDPVGGWKQPWWAAVRSGEDLCHHARLLDAGEFEVEALELAGEVLVVDAELVENSVG